MHSDLPSYSVGLRLYGKRVLVVGGGQVAQRRIPALIAAGAHVELVSPEATPAIEGMARAGEISWDRREFRPEDLHEAWYCMAVTDSAEANARVVAEADRLRVFCVRGDDAEYGSAITPAHGHVGGMSIAVMGSDIDHRDPRRSAAVRDAIVAGLHDGTIAEDQGEKTPEVVLIGGGPGDPGLITVAGRRALMTADVVIADRLAPRELLGELPSTTELIDVAKLPRGRSALQSEINRLIIERVQEGKSVARYKGGDNFVFGRGYEEILACREAGVPFRIIPGVSSPIAVPGLAGLPVTHRGVTHEFTVVSGHIPPGHPDSLINWQALAQMRGTIVIMMGVENAGAIAAELIGSGRDSTTPVGIVRHGSMPTQRSYETTLGELGDKIASDSIEPPAIIVVGDVVKVASAWLS